jgi:hypothetical protein
MAACLGRVFTEEPPTVTVRLTAFDVNDSVISKAESGFLRRLTYRGHGYCFVREWQHDGTGRHIHLAIRSNGPLTTEEVGELWQAALASAASKPEVKQTHYAAPVRDVAALAHYLAKNGRGRGALVPRSFRGRIFGCSKGFLPKPLKRLWRDIREGWRLDVGGKGDEKDVPQGDGHAHDNDTPQNENPRSVTQDAARRGLSAVGQVWPAELPLCPRQAAPRALLLPFLAGGRQAAEAIRAGQDGGGGPQSVRGQARGPPHRSGRVGNVAEPVGRCP